MRVDGQSASRSQGAAQAARAARRPGRILGVLVLLLAAGLAAPPRAELQAPAPPATQAAPVPPAGGEFMRGDTWALVVGVNVYPFLAADKQLTAARPGAETVARVLRQYGVERDRLTQLYDDNATKEGVLGHIRGPLRRDARPDDSVLIFFAGRCDEIEDPTTRIRDVGWLPSNAVEGDPTSSIRMNELRVVLNNIPARHILVVADACVGDFLVGTSTISGDPTVREVYQKKSRWVLAAATAPPPAGAGEGIGDFTQAFVDSLRENQLAYLTPLHLGQELTRRLPPAANRTLKNGPMAGMGDDNEGQFVFRLDGASPPTTEIRVPALVDPRIARIQWEIGQIQEMPLRSPLKAQALAALEERLTGIRQEIEEQRRGLEARVREQIAKQAERQAEAERGPVAPAKPEDLTPMVLIPAGEFTMGSTPRDGPPDEQPQRQITLDAYQIDKYETTVGRYAKYLVATRARPPRYWDQVNPESDSDFPVVGVDWDEANNYCKWAGKRLPTEAEWEKAARGTDGRKHPWGSEGPTPQFANLGRGGTFGYGKSLEKVGNFDLGKSPFGVFDMIGNVWEWVADWYDRNAYKTMPDKNPKGPDKEGERGAQRVIRGGSWERVPLVARVAGRHRATPSTQNGYIGFRCAKDAQ